MCQKPSRLTRSLLNLHHRHTRVDLGRKRDLDLVGGSVDSVVYGAEGQLDGLEGNSPSQGSSQKSTN